MAPAGFVVAAVLGFVQAVGNEAGDEQVEMRVVVVVEPDRVGEPAARGDADLFGDLFEAAIAQVPEQLVAAVGGQVQVCVTVGIEIRGRHAHAEPPALNAGGLCHVAERAVAIVAVQRVRQFAVRLEEVGRPAIDQVDVHPAVPVKVEEGASRADGLGQVAGV